jgi:hypothetical protein
MGDVICPKCGEPYESYGITYAKGEGDLSVEEAKRFMRGEGCPACGFGTLCPRCHGGCIEKNNCATCFGDGYVFAKRCLRATDARFRQWFIGYSNSPQYPLRFFDQVEILRAEQPEESLDGLVYVAKVKCPDCHGKGAPCSECGGDGKFHGDKQPDYFNQAVNSLLDNSDEEPIGVLMRFTRGMNASGTRQSEPLQATRSACSAQDT